MSKVWSGVAGLSVVLASVVSSAAEPAATAQLPAALMQLGAAPQVLSAAEAHRVRGQATTFGQVFQLEIRNGTGVGTTLIAEGLLAQVKYNNGAGLTIEGTVAGLQGAVGSNSGALVVSLQGKALQQTTDFAGQFIQAFAQQLQQQ